MCIKLERGISLIEQIIFMVIVSVGVVALLSTFNAGVLHSADPMLRKQSLTIAESLLNEILHQPFTLCDPDDANASTATLSGAAPTCAVAAADQNKGGAALTSPTSHSATVVEERGGGAAGTQFDNVADYGGYSQVAATDATGGNVMAGYSTSVAITRVGDTLFNLPADAVLEVAVTVSHAGMEPITLTGYRFRYAPRY